MAKAQVVYVVQYGHKHGEDLWACSTLEKAEASIGETIQEYLEDLSDESAKKKIKKYLKEGKPISAANLWFGLMEEWFEIHHLKVT